MLDRLLFLRHLEPDEELQKIVHKHWIVILLAVLWPGASFLLATVTIALLPYRPIVLLAGGWAAFSIIWWIRNFFGEYLDAWIVTDAAIINVEWFGWFHRKSTRILYSDIEEVSYEIQGILATLFRYGTLSIERVATGSVVDLDYVKSPREVESMILRNMETYLHTKNLKDATHVQEILSEIVAEQLQLRDIEDAEEEEETVSL
ncbi:PH domain-containing protein [Candidatus Peregrinibacteria bacterium]|nr:PH domain-containing protein [Candidatus Peregrinibacteria bacterium]